MDDDSLNWHSINEVVKSFFQPVIRSMIRSSIA